MGHFPGRKCYSCKIYQVEYALSECPTCGEPICGLPGCKALCRCDLIIPKTENGCVFSDKLMESLGNHTEVSSWIKNPRGMYTHANPRFVEHCGNMIGSNTLDVFGDGHLAREMMTTDALVTESRRSHTSVMEIPLNRERTTLVIEKALVHGDCVFGYAIQSDTRIQLSGFC